MNQNTPTRIEPRDPDLRITWNDGHVFDLGYRLLRFACVCANCVDEITGERIIELEKIPETVRPVKVEPVGQYAVKIGWNDGHSTGIFHFERLNHLCQNHGKKVNDVEIK